LRPIQKKHIGGIKMFEDIYGIWIGENATIAIIDEYRVSFLRLKEDLIVSVLHHNTHGTVGVVYGFGTDFDAHSVVSAVSPISRAEFFSSDEATDYINNHSADTVEYNTANKKLTYTMFDGRVFELTMSEKINMEDFDKVNEVDNTLPISQRMALWGVGKHFEYLDDSGYFLVGIDTQKYSILFSFSLPENWVYCRVGQNGYCEKGRAMLSTVCIRQNETRMIKDNLSSINDYKPDEDCFIVDGCSFPPDGGWYWSVKEVTDDIIYLNGCGETYEIHRK
jgi:hypothetical protein